MKKLITAMMVFSLAAALALAGCSGAKKGDAGKDGKAAAEKAAPPADPYAALGADFCNKDKISDVMFSDAFLQILVKVMIKGIMASMPPGQEIPPEMKDMVDEAKMLEEMKKMKDEKKDIPVFSSCSAKSKTISCDEAYKKMGEMASTDEQFKKMLGDDPAKAFSDIIKEIGGVKDCGILSVTAQEEGKDKPDTVDFIVGEVKGKQSILFFNKDSIK
jgi:hypothetical protein